MLVLLGASSSFVAPPHVAPTRGSHSRTDGAARMVLRGPAETATLPLAAAARQLSSLLSRSRSIPCPFFRRRAGDSLEAALAVAQELAQFLAARHKSLELPAELLAVAPPTAAALPKARGLSLDAVMDTVRADFESGQYYVTGRLTQQSYADDCLFDGPDPDMPVRSLQRYSDALRGLFDPKLSSIELLALEPRADRRFVAHWTLRGALKLPWRPTIPEYRGATVYEVDDDGLICCHTEAWSISALEAFGTTLFPGLQRDDGEGGGSSWARIEADAHREHEKSLQTL